jgi:hypothetical protein
MILKSVITLFLVTTISFAQVQTEHETAPLITTPSAWQRFKRPVLYSISTIAGLAVGTVVVFLQKTKDTQQRQALQAAVQQARKKHQELKQELQAIPLNTEQKEYITSTISTIVSNHEDNLFYSKKRYQKLCTLVHRYDKAACKQRLEQTIATFIEEDKALLKALATMQHSPKDFSGEQLDQLRAVLKKHPYHYTSFFQNALREFHKEDNSLTQALHTLNPQRKLNQFLHFRQEILRNLARTHTGQMLKTTLEKTITKFDTEDKELIALLKNHTFYHYTPLTLPTLQALFVDQENRLERLYTALSAQTDKMKAKKINQLLTQFDQEDCQPSLKKDVL